MLSKKPWFLLLGSRNVLTSVWKYVKVLADCGILTCTSGFSTAVTTDTCSIDEPTTLQLWILRVMGSFKKKKKTNGAVALWLFCQGAQRRLIVHTRNQFQKEANFWQNILDRDFSRRIQASSSIEVRFWKLTKYETQLDLLPFSAHQDSNLNIKVGNYAS